MSMTPEQKKAASERMKAMHAAKKAAKESSKEQPIKEPVEKIYNQSDIETLQRQVQELTQYLTLSKKLGAEPQASTQNIGQVQGGRIVGVTDKYVVDPEYYPDFTKRLSAEQRLERFAFDRNYEIEYEFNTTQYQTKEGVWQKEPVFKLTLTRIAFDEEGNPTSRRFLIGDALFFEDPQSAIQVARRLGYDVNNTNEKEFLDEMRYIQMKEWLLENFYPPVTWEKKSNLSEEVIGGKLVTTFEITSQNSERVPFDQINTKL